MSATPITNASPLQLAAHYRHRERMERMAPKAPAQVHEALPEPLPLVLALPPEEPVETPPSAVPVPWIGRVDIKRITEAVSDHFGITRRDLYSRRRTKEIVLPRQIAMYLAKTVTLKSLPEVGRRIGGRDHTTVLHAVRKIEAAVLTDPEMAARIDAIKESMGIEA
jgi:hypothetical protein